jgi:Amt family ammonium transporter
MIIGLLAGLICYVFVMVLKAKFGYDDALDTFGVHAVGGTLGAILTGVLATSSVNSNLVSEGYTLKNGLAKMVGGVITLDKTKLITSQFIAIGITLAISIVGTLIIAFIVKAIVGLRAEPDQEVAGLDISEHGEEGYIL